MSSVIPCRCAGNLPADLKGGNRFPFRSALEHKKGAVNPGVRGAFFAFFGCINVGGAVPRGSGASPQGLNPQRYLTSVIFRIWLKSPASRL